MSTATLEPETDLDFPEDANEYRALHAGAIVGVLVALCSLIYPLSIASLTDMQYLLILAGIPLVALVVSFAALRSIRSNREVYTGERVAFAGVVLSLLSLLGGSAYGGYVFATEVPEGYTRTSFQEMKPDAEDEEALRPVPLEIQELIKTQADVFIKGYIRPSSVQYKRGNKEFLLVRDNNQCCFGDLSKVMFFDQVMVNLTDGLAVDYTDGLVRLGGKMSVRPGNPAAEEPQLVYTMEANYVK